jgi:CheY-like chemotaxis protein
MQRVLIIDDDEQVRALLHEILDRAGYEVTEAANGLEGLNLYRAGPVDLVITDLLMPEKEGVETIVELRREFPDARIIAMSGGGRNAGRDYLSIAAQLGAGATMAKPFSRQEVLNAIRDVLAA